MSPAPFPAGVGGGSAIGDLLAGGAPGQGADQVREQLQALASQIRDLGSMADAIATDFPAAGQEIGQIKALLKAVIVKAAQAAPAQTASGSAVPTGASMGPSPQ